jgi:hypothetical protein
MGSTVEHHVGAELCLVNLTGFGAGNSDSNGDALFHQVGHVVIWGIARDRLDGEITRRIGPHHAAINKEKADAMAFVVGDPGELKTPRCFLVIIFTQYKQKISHLLPPFLIWLARRQRFLPLPHMGRMDESRPALRPYTLDMQCEVGTGINN